MSTNTTQPIPLSVYSNSQSYTRWFGDLAKRVLDVVASFLGLIALSPFFLMIAIMLKRESAGPVFYRGPRTGKDGKPFNILKFRTMYEHPTSYAGSRVTAQDDERITPLGSRLRATKLNELPQLWNVLKGDMSLVGPRPEDPQITATWPIDARHEILSVRPGITSPTSVAYHDEEQRLNTVNVMDDYLANILPDKLRLDRLYVRHHTFMTDLDALFWTFVIMIPRLGKDKISEGWLFGGPFSRIARRYVSWFVIDFLLAFITIGLTGLLWRMFRPLDMGWGPAVGMAVMLALLFGIFNSALGLKTVSWERATPEHMVGLFVSCGLIMLMVGLAAFVAWPATFFPIEFGFFASLMVLAGCVIARYRLRLLTGFASRWLKFRRSTYGVGERVLIVGAGEGGEFATWLLQRSDFRNLYSLVGIVDDDPAKQGLHFDGSKVLGTTGDIPDLVKRYDIGVIFYAIANISASDSKRILSICKRTNLHLVMISDMLRTFHARLTKSLPRCERTCPYLVDGPVVSDELEMETINA